MTKKEEEEESHHIPLSKIREASIAREAAKKQFWNVIFEAWPKVRETCSQHWNGPDAVDCEFEKSVMREHIEVWEHGAVMSIVVFAALRLTAHPKFEHVAERYIKPFFSLTPPKPKAPAGTKKSPSKRNKSTQLQPNLKTASTSSHSSAKTIIEQPVVTAANRNVSVGGRQFKSYLEQQRDAHVHRIHKAAEAPHDFMVATLVGLSATVFFMRPSQMRLDFEETPLSPGRSFWSEQMCDDFVQIYRDTDPSVFDFEKLDKPDANLKSFEKFALHCILRSEYIQKRKREGQENPLVLPTNGPWETTPSTGDDDSSDHKK